MMQRPIWIKLALLAPNIDDFPLPSPGEDFSFFQPRMIRTTGMPFPIICPQVSLNFGLKCGSHCEEPVSVGPMIIQSKWKWKLLFGCQWSHSMCSAVYSIALTCWPLTWPVILKIFHGTVSLKDLRNSSKRALHYSASAWHLPLFQGARWQIDGFLKTKNSNTCVRIYYISSLLQFSNGRSD